MLCVRCLGTVTVRGSTRGPREEGTKARKTGESLRDGSVSHVKGEKSILFAILYQRWALVIVHYHYVFMRVLNQSITDNSHIDVNICDNSLYICQYMR